MRSAVLIAVMAAVTMLLRFLPFLVFRKEPPAYITYLGKVLPPAIIGMLVIYCLKDVSLTVHPFGVPDAGEAFVFLPLGVDAALDLTRVVDFR